MLDQLLLSPEPIIRYRTRVFILGIDPHSPDLLQLGEEIRTSPRVLSLLSDREEDGEIPFHPYTKWQGAHWVLTMLADCSYPEGDKELLPLRDQVYAWLFSDDHQNGYLKRTAGRSWVRLHASQEANALFASLTLGLTDSRTEDLVKRLMWAQWEDGGWNCDRNNKADSSSFYESITPLRALAFYARISGNSEVKLCVERAAEVFLKRGLFRRVKDGEVMNGEFLKLRFPTFHYYNILWGLKIMAEAGFINDPRCQEALEVLESKQLPDGGFSAQGKYYYVTRQTGEPYPHGSRADWGIVSPNKSNEFMSVEALAVLRAAGRLRFPKKS